MSEDTNPGTETKINKGRDTLWIIGAFGLMIIAIFTIWQFLLKGKSEEERSLLKDTVIQVKTDTVRLKDSIKLKQEVSNHTNTSINERSENKPDSSKIKSKIENLTDDDKARIKDKFEDLPKKKQDKIKKKLKTSLSK